MVALHPKPRYYIYDVPKGSHNHKRIYFGSYEEAKRFVKTHRPAGGDNKGIYHIYPVDKSGYFSESDGRKSFGEGNKEWSKGKRR